jgi:Helix-turn-helix domain
MTPADLKAWRTRLKWSKAEASRQLGISPNGYAGYEAGRGPFPFISPWRAPRSRTACHRSATARADVASEAGIRNLNAIINMTVRMSKM